MSEDQIKSLAETLEAERNRHIGGYQGPRHYVAQLLDKAASALTDLEAENARLKAEVERLRKLASKPPIVKYALRATEARLVEALKALMPFALVAEHDIGEDETDNDLFRPIERNRAPRLTVGHFRAARRVLEGDRE